MSVIYLRKAERRDAPAILKMVIFARLNPTRLDWRRFRLAVDGSGRIIGCVQIKLHRDGSEELASLVVVEEWRDRGVARILIETVVAEHSGPLYLMCRTELGELYQRFGFQALTRDQMWVYFRRVARLMGDRILIMGREC